jgi:hypothetical protein
MSIGKSRKSRADNETLPAVSKARRTQRCPVKAAILHGHPFRVNATRFPGRRFLRLAAGAAAVSAMSRIARAQTYPTRPITIIVGSAAGGPTDTIGRIITDPMRVSLGQAIIIENNGSAGGSIAHGRVARAAPDGSFGVIGFIGIG